MIMYYTFDNYNPVETHLLIDIHTMNNLDVACKAGIGGTVVMCWTAGQQVK